MESNREVKRRKDKNDEEEEKRRENKSKKARTRSRSPAETREKDFRRKRRHSRSRSPNVAAKQDKQTIPEKESEVKKEAPTRRNKDTDMLNTRTGGAYIPPARLRMMQAQITDKTSVAYQRLAWEALKKSIHGHINKINVGNIGIIIKELLKENIVRGRGLLCRSVIQAQAASPTFTNVYAALVAAVNSRFPNIGELLLKRLVIQFKRGFKRNDKSICISSASFIAHLVNQRVAHEILALELLTLLVETPTDDSVEVAIAFLKESGQKLTEVSSKGVNAIFEMLRNILHEGQLDKRVQYMIEVMFQVWKDGFKDHPALIEELELVPEEDQFTHLMMLDEATDPQDILNVFKFDDKYEDNEQKYKTLSKEILGSDAESGEEDSSGESGSDEEDDDEEQEQKEVTIIDNTETNLVALRRTIYLTINSSLDFEECAHKLMKMQLKPGQEVELCHMFLDCCAEQRTYEKFYGLLAQRFCNINRIYIGPFEEIFKDSYATAHRLDTNRLRNVSKFFAHLLFTDSISWEVLECVKLNEEDTTSSSRIYIKILFQELAEYMGLKKLNDRLKDPTLQDAFSGLFPRDNPKNTRFSINFFTSIGLGGLTDELREHLKQMPKNVPPPITEIKLDSGSSSDTSSDSSSSSSESSSSSDSSSSDDEGEKSKKKKAKSKKDKNKEKVPETLAEQVAKDKNERWGHDGFYDTYGKDAKRLESRPDREDFARPWDKRNNQRNGDDRRGSRNDDPDDDFRRDRSDFRDRRDDRSQRDEGRSRNDNRANERETIGRKDDERSRRNDDRNVDRVRRDDDRIRNNDRLREESREDSRNYRNEDRTRKTDDRTRRDDDRNRRDDDRSWKGDDRNNRSRKYDDRFKSDEKRQTNDDRPRKDDDRELKENRMRKEDDRGRRRDERNRKDDDRPHRDEDRERDDDRTRKNNDEYRDDRDRKGEDRSRRDDERFRRNDDRNREDDNRGHKSDDKEDRGRRDDERFRRNDDRDREDDNRGHKSDDKEHKEDRGRKGDDRSRRDDDRHRRADEREYRDDRIHKDDERDRRGDDRIRREELEDNRNKKKIAEDRNERENNRRKERDDENFKANREESDSRPKKKDHYNEKDQNGDHRNDEDRNSGDNKSKEKTEERKAKKNEKEHKKKNKKEKKGKKDKKKNKDVDSDTEEHLKRKSKHGNDDNNHIKKKDKKNEIVQTESDSSSSISSEDDTIGPDRYWDKFDIKSRNSARKEELKIRHRRERS